MIELDWSQTQTGVVCGRYRILRRSGDSDLPWRLDAIDQASSCAGPRVVETARCVSLDSAKRMAIAIEQRRARTLRASIHGAGGFACVYTFALVASAPLASFASLLVAIIALGLAVRCIGNAVGAKRKDLWGWQPNGRPSGRPSPMQRLCEALVRWSTVRTPSQHPTTSVTVLPPV